jgi:hypothetical protein
MLISRLPVDLKSLREFGYAMISPGGSSATSETVHADAAPVAAAIPS